jgi:hypothetical protein
MECVNTKLIKTLPIFRVFETADSVIIGIQKYFMFTAESGR